MANRIQSEGFEVRLTVHSDVLPSPIVNEEDGPKWRRGFFRNRKKMMKAADDDSVSVSSWKSFGSHMSERSRRSWLGAFRRRKKSEPKDMSDNDSIESTSNKSGKDEKSTSVNAEPDENLFPWLDLDDSCYFFQCLCTPSTDRKPRRRKFSLFSRR